MTDNQKNFQTTFLIVEILQWSRDNPKKFTSATGIKKIKRDSFMTLTVDDIMQVLKNIYGIQWIERGAVIAILKAGGKLCFRFCIGSYQESDKNDKDKLLREAYWFIDKYKKAISCP